MVISNELRLVLERLEAERLAGRAQCRRIAVAILTVGIATTAGLHFSSLDLAALIAAAVSAVGIFTVLRIHKGRVTRGFRKALLPELVAAIDPSLNYTASGHVSEAEFQHSKLWQAPDRYAGRDLVEGSIGDTALKFSLVHAEEKYEETETDSDGHQRTTTRYRTLFCGLFLSLDFNKDFSKRTTLRPRASGILNRLGRSHVATEDPRFNELFTVSSSDQVEARYLLTPSLMERLMALRERLGDFHLAFSQGRMYLAVKRPLTLFDPDVSAPLTDTGQVARLVGLLTSMTDVVRDLDLNTRMWTKTGRSEDSALSECA